MARVRGTNCGRRRAQPAGIPKSQRREDQKAKTQQGRVSGGRRAARPLARTIDIELATPRRPTRFRPRRSLVNPGDPKYPEHMLDDVRGDRSFRVRGGRHQVSSGVTAIWGEVVEIERMIVGGGGGAGGCWWERGDG